MRPRILVVVIAASSLVGVIAPGQSVLDRIKAGADRANKAAQKTQPKQQPQPPQQPASQPPVAQQPPPEARDASSGDPGTPETTARLAASAGKYDVAGIKLGMPIKDALLALKAHNPNFRLKPESIKYDLFPYPLTYGISAVPLNLTLPEFRYSTNPGTIPPNSEAFYFALTMPPNREVVWKISRLVTFDKNTAPTGDVVASDLINKYGRPSWDDGPALLNGSGARNIFWIDDTRGNRLQIARDMAYQCAALTTFKIAHAYTDPSLITHLTATSLQLDPRQSRHRIEQGYFNNAEWRSEQCASYSMIQARLFDTRSIGITTPGLVAGMLVTMANGPLDHAATDATHAYLVRANKERDAKRTDAAKQNRPKL